MENEQEQSQELTIIDRSVPEFRNGNAILRSHQDRASKALGVAKSIQDQWLALYELKQTDPDQFFSEASHVDERSNKFLANCSAALKQMKESRSPFTSMVNMIITAFTAEENTIDAKYSTPVSDVQKFRNKYATDLKVRQDQIKANQERKVAKQKEVNELVANIPTKTETVLRNVLYWHRQNISKHYDGINMENFEGVSEGIKNYKVAFPWGKLDELKKNAKSDIIGASYFRILSQTEIDELVDKGLSEYNFDSFAPIYEKQIVEWKQQCIDQLPSKFENLTQEKKARDANNAAEAERLQKQREDNAKKEQERREADAKRHDEELQAKNNIAKETANAQSLFDSHAELMSEEKVPQTRASFNIVVKAPAGWIQLVSFWFEEIGKSTPLEDFDTMTFAKAKKYAEGRMKKDGKKIESPLLVYEEEIKAVNHKEKKS